MAGVKLQNIYKRYGDTTVVQDVNLEIKDKEFIVLVGPSGCGKSTTLRMIAGLEEISDGDMYIGDKRLNNMPPKDRDIAMVFQNYALYPHMDVYENMAFGLKMRKFAKPEIDKRVQEAASILNLESLLKRKPKDLSGGQRQRVALGRAIVREPQVFLMDEPLSNLDAKLRVQMRTEISKLQKRLQTTTVYVTHDQTEAMTMGDRLVVMKDGIIQQIATPDEIYNAPVNMFVAGFIGSPAMNFINGNLQAQGNKVIFTACGVEWKLTNDQAKKVSNLNYIGKEVIIGIRPEDIRNEDVSTESQKENIYKTCIEVQENTGAEVYLHCTGVADTMLTLRSDCSIKMQCGEKVTLSMDMEKAHLFDKSTQQNIMLCK
ncbi:ABC transporter ATP-binding protein [Pelosinus baikalensis]|uniref:Sn-glycerol-3-phosphate ABC transporter ATP-binding protein UgpC n=1 Tax=Pelosinus baikalensis TaxID=2892015 RepID=A0ABS8HTC0_9FIRM|nr:sn-glycerol-3-phosphate ABC transporter ATP-binding protein UgpC [Pelosinus baikalensis]MCC5466330.1 sn-glycerol-3-phosphate ABC transporter ATP-binding protein UgpC [Pelosinus baikalensis]